VSWHQAVDAPDVAAVPSPYETDRFGVSVDRIGVAEAAKVTLDEVRALVRGSAADVVVLRYPADRVGWFAALAGDGRVALMADSLVYWRLKVGSGRRPEPAPSLRTAVDRDVEPATVDALVADMFAAYGNHYLANPLFDPALALAGYQQWARRSVADVGAVVVRDADQLLGLATLEHTPGRTEILLAGVVSAAQGRGIYAHLLAEVERQAAERGAAELVISTQGHNVRVQRAWARYGFEPVHALLTVHLVRPDLLAER
jgi:ribosomal protein S18 acetylase RimI-like enzyme